MLESGLGLDLRVGPAIASCGVPEIIEPASTLLRLIVSDATVEH